MMRLLSGVARRPQRLPLLSCASGNKPLIGPSHRYLSSEGRSDETKGAMSSYMKSSGKSADAKPWMKNLKQHKPHEQYFAVDDESGGGEGSDDGGSSSSGERRNNRGRGGNRRGDGGGGGGGGGEIRRRKEDDTRGVSEPILNMIDDWSHFEDLGRRGLTVDTRDMDDFEAFMAVIYAESAKSSDHTVWGTMEEGADEKGRGGKRSKVRIPHPRTTRQLARTTVPQICPETGGSPQSEGYKLAAEAWHVLAKNPYYTLEEKKNMCNRIARRANWYLDESKGIYDEELDESEQPHANKNRLSKQDIEAAMVWDDDFRKGLEGLEEEEARKLELEEEELLKRQKNYVEQDETDWNVEAVVDEDDLFK